MILKCFAGGLDLKDTVVMPRDILCLATHKFEFSRQMPTFFCLCNLQMSRSSIIRPSYCSPYHHLAVHLIYFLSKFEVCQILGSFNTLLVMSDTWLKNTLLHFRFVKEILGEITMY